LRAQNKADFELLKAENLKIVSKVLDEERKVYIYVPPVDSLNSTKGYPVMYLTKDDETLDNAISLFEMNTVNFPSSGKSFNSLGDAYAKKG